MSGNENKQVQRIWDELAAFDSSEGTVALDFLLREIIKLIGADDGFWVGAVRTRHGAAARRDLQFGWRGRAVRRLDPTPRVRKVSAAIARKQDTPEAPMTTIAVAAAAGEFRAVRLRDLVNMERFRRTAHYRAVYESPGIEDRMWISFPVSPAAESHFVFDRVRPSGRFTCRDMLAAARVLRGLGGFHREALLIHGLLVAKKPLSSVQQQVMALLLTEAPEKAIAQKLGQSIHTTHTHVREIFRHFGVSGRPGLMATWLKGR